MSARWAQMTAARMSPSDPWERLLVNGLARDFQQMRLDFLRRAMAGTGNPAAAALSALGPSYIKLGQFLATRADVIGPAVAKDLSRRLRDACEALLRLCELSQRV